MNGVETIGTYVQALKLQCHVVKNALLQTVFSVILPTGWDHLYPFVFAKVSYLNFHQKEMCKKRAFWMSSINTDLKCGVKPGHFVCKRWNPLSYFDYQKTWPETIHYNSITRLHWKFTFNDLKGPTNLSTYNLFSVTIPSIDTCLHKTGQKLGFLLWTEPWGLDSTFSFTEGTKN